jgi:hypothetical protein
MTYELLITFWNENDDETNEVIILTDYPQYDDETNEVIILTDYPQYDDVENTLDYLDLSDFKTYGGKFDWFEITKITEI